MKILVVGAGLSGCTVARLLHERGHDVRIIEKSGRIGGLCVTNINEYGLKYEPFGARTFHTRDQKIIDFITRFDSFNGYRHLKKMIIDGRIFPFPIHKEAIEGFKDSEIIFNELESRPKEIDKTNFETACISVFGKTLYNYFIGNYTEKMWGMPPKNLTAEWAGKRLELRNDGSEGVFANQWQGLPCNGYSFLLEKISKDIPVTLVCSKFNENDYDIVISTAPIDETMGFVFGRLPYRSFEFYYKNDESWEDETCGTINLPQHDTYIRKCNFKILHKQESAHNIIQYQKPIAADKNHVSMYPVNTPENNSIFDSYLKEICKTKNTVPVGRLATYRYLDMDKAVSYAFDSIGLIENYLEMSPEQRYNEITKIRSKY